MKVSAEVNDREFQPYSNACSINVKYIHYFPVHPSSKEMVAKFAAEGWSYFPILLYNL